jgi:hypothetical protein
MKCFYHRDREAVGLCKSCGKGLCGDCQTDLGQGLACKDRCEDRVRSLIALIDHNVRVAPAARTIMRLNRRTWVLVGLFALITGIFITILSASDERIRLVVPLGLLVSLFGVVLLVLVWKLPRVPDATEASRPRQRGDQTTSWT